MKEIETKDGYQIDNTIYRITMRYNGRLHDNKLKYMI